MAITGSKRPSYYRFGASGHAICPHRDLSVCESCAASDPALVLVWGEHFYANTDAEKALFLAESA